MREYSRKAVTYLAGKIANTTFSEKEGLLEMKTVKFGKVRKALKGKGFLIALVLSVTAVGASTYLAYNQAISKIGGLGDNSEYSEIFDFGNYQDENAPVGKTQGDVPLDREETTPATEAETVEAGEAMADNAPAEEANNFIEPAPPKTMPVEGEVSLGFSNGELVKSKTLGVWKTHDGVDIAAEMGTPVKSMTNGTVSEVYSDALWGVCVTIDHNDGVLGCYFGLDKNVSVSVGQTVSAGDVIGSVGNTAEIEIAESSHIHFAVKKNGSWVDPVAFIAG